MKPFIQVARSLFSLEAESAAILDYLLSLLVGERYRYVHTYITIHNISLVHDTNTDPWPIPDLPLPLN